MFQNLNRRQAGHGAAKKTGRRILMVKFGLLVTCEAKSGLDHRVEEFLLTAAAMVRQEPATTAWFGIRFGRSEYGILDVFPDETSREAHLNGPVAKALREMTIALFTRPPEIRRLTVLSEKLPVTAPPEPSTKGLLLTFKPKAGHETDVKQFLRDAQPFVLDEPKTTAWFALQFDDGTCGIFDVFPDAGGRFAHLTGHVPRELAKHALTLLGSVPDMDMLNVVAEKLPR
jgi:quinol monooxygenase YgiN